MLLSLLKKLMSETGGGADMLRLLSNAWDLLIPGVGSNVVEIKCFKRRSNLTENAPVLWQEQNSLLVRGRIYELS